MREKNINIASLKKKMLMENDQLNDAALDFSRLPWKFEYYYKTDGYIVQVEPNRKEILVFIPDNKITLIADVAPYLDLRKLRAGRTYKMDFAVYSVTLNKKVKETLIKKVKEPYLRDKSKYRKEYNIGKLKPLEQFFIKAPKIYRFELIKIIDHYYSRLIENKFEQSVLNSFKARTKFRWRHLLGF